MAPSPQISFNRLQIGIIRRIGETSNCPRRKMLRAMLQFISKTIRIHIALQLVIGVIIASYVLSRNSEAVFHKEPWALLPFASAWSMLLYGVSVVALTPMLASFRIAMKMESPPPTVFVPSSILVILGYALVFFSDTTVLHNLGVRFFMSGIFPWILRATLKKCSTEASLKCFSRMLDYDPEWARAQPVVSALGSYFGYRLVETAIGQPTDLQAGS
jgi:hypothetical protein